MLYEFDSWKQLSAREQQTIVDNYDTNKPKSLSEAITLVIKDIKINSRRLPLVKDIINSLDNPFYDLDDRVETMASDEEKYLSCALTCSKIDGIDLNVTTYACKDIANGTITGKANIAAEVVSVRTYKTKRGKNPGQLMAFLCVEDGTGTLDSVTVFPECYAEHKDLLVENNTLLIIGEVSKKDKCSIIANQFSQI
jgi:DNA polymerase III alpha subunit